MAGLRKGTAMTWPTFPFQARKPYTISKARERWSEEEHQRFVEAVRLHGRAWRKIEGELKSWQQQAGTAR